MKRLIISVIVLACVLTIAGGGVYYRNQNSLYIRTDNDKVQADIVPIKADAGDSKEMERVPVKIAADDFSGKYIAPGMNATVKIDKS